MPVVTRTHRTPAVLLAASPLAAVAATPGIRVHTPALHKSRDFAESFWREFGAPAIGTLILDPLALERAAVGPRVHLRQKAA